ncbi:hypothetical protein [Pseudobutyrivibrio ruminis]|uniref:hypothetical protein n=1 Tax=Pseudobutyrivibrio ruminis TaxID=46206 RepID=UPI00051C2CB9|nr:hypothetical protein [Pseudobutyrivibrio ruminis]
MEEYSRILIEQYCMTHTSTKKSKFLQELVELSYDVECEPEEKAALQLEAYINQEKDEELREALEDLDEFLFG